MRSPNITTGGGDSAHFQSEAASGERTTATPGLVAEVPPKFARAGGSRPDFGPKKSKKTHKNTHKIKIK
jgi:hypothetical protein